jgi:glyoxylase-like metal-dependent hydrolase (beta-lactamase superfamily II)
VVAAVTVGTAASALTAVALAPTVSATTVSARPLAAPSPAATTPTYVPVPAYAKPRPVPAKGYVVDDLGHGGYAVTNGTYNTMFFVGTKGVVVVDAPQQLGANLLAAVREKTSKPITDIVYSHAHTDHTAAAYLYRKGVRIWAEEGTARLLARAEDPRRPLPNRVVRGLGRHVLRVPGVTLYLDYYGINHEEGELFLYAPVQRALMHVDLMFPRWAPFKQLAIAEDVPGFVQALDITLKYPFRYLVAGHLGWLGTRADAVTQRRYVTDLVDAGVVANNSVDYVKVTAGTDKDNQWLQYKIYSDAVTQKCMDLMPKHWLTELGGADVFLEDNCFTMTEHQRIDGDPLIGSDRIYGWNPQT